MTAISSTTASSPLPQPKNKEEVCDLLTAYALQVMKEISSEQTRRTEGYRSNIQLLGSGIFLKEHYRDILESIIKQNPPHKAAKSAHQRLHYLAQRGNFVYGYISLEHFKVRLVHLGKSASVPYFVCRKRTTPHEAIEALTKQLTLLSSMEISQIAYYKAFELLIGVERFDSLFNPRSCTRLMIGKAAPANPLIPFFQQRASFRPQTGDLVTFENFLGKLETTIHSPEDNFLGLDWHKAATITQHDGIDSKRVADLFFSTQTKAEFLITKWHALDQRAQVMKTKGLPMRTHSGPKKQLTTKEKARIWAREQQKPRSLRFMEIILEQHTSESDSDYD